MEMQRLILHPNTRPHEVSLTNDLLRTAFTTSVTGYWFGTAVGLIKAGTSIEAFMSGVLLRDAAIGTITAVSLGAAWVISVWAVSMYHSVDSSYRQNSPPRMNSNEDNRALERTKAFYRPSVSPFNTWDVRVFLVSQAVSVLAAVIFINTASQQESLLGDYPGRAMGSMIGAILGLLVSERIGRSIATHCLEDPMNRIKKRHWYKESRHDVPFYTSLFFAAWSVYAAYSIYDNSATDFNFDIKAYNHARLAWTLLFSGFSLFSPLFFSTLRTSLKRHYDAVKRVIRGIPIIGSPTNAFWLSQRWYNESRMDIPWPVRLFCGVFAALTLGTVMANYHQTPFNKESFYIYITFTTASPMLFALTRKILSLTTHFNSEEEVDRNPPVKMGFDMPWYARIAIASLAGMMIGQSIEYNTWDPKTYFTNPPAPSYYPVLGAWLTVSLAVMAPMMMAGLGKFGFKHPILNPVEDKHEDRHLPWYANLLAGVWMGALLGAAFGNLYNLGDPQSIIPAYIGPEFLGLSNAVGATMGVFVGGPIGLIWPIVRFGWDYLVDKQTTHFFCLPRRYGAHDSATETRSLSNDQFGSVQIRV